MLDFAALPPEINSARMYSGAGAAPMLAASAAWSQLAAEMRSAAASYSSVITNLSSGSWQGPASTSMADAAAPYAAWMNTTAAQAEQTAAQAQAAATAYESAFSMTVPPQVIAANRTLLASLVANNVLGQNAPSIAATEAQYGEMWAQDAAAMYGYAGSSATASQLTPFSQPAQTTNATGLASQAAAVAQASGTSAGTAGASTSASSSAGLSSLLGGITTSGSNTSTTGLAGLLNDLDGSNGSLLGSFLNNNTVDNFSNAFTTSGLFNPGALGSGVLPGVGGLGSGLSAGMGEAGRVGALSVPPSWSAVAPTSPIASALGGTPLAPPGPVAGGPGGVASPMSNMNGRLRRAVPKYGMRLPPVMARPPAAG